MNWFMRALYAMAGILDAMIAIAIKLGYLSPYPRP